MIEGKLNDKGFLFVKRGGKLKSQTCPNNTFQCGDWCPLFGEPKSYNEAVRLILGCAKPATAVLSFDKFKDERE